MTPLMGHFLPPLPFPRAEFCFLNKCTTCVPFARATNLFVGHGATSLPFLMHDNPPYGLLCAMIALPACRDPPCKSLHDIRVPFGRATTPIMDHCAARWHVVPHFGSLFCQRPTSWITARRTVPPGAKQVRSRVTERRRGLLPDNGCVFVLLVAAIVSADAW